jgi:hypothetical protein
MWTISRALKAQSGQPNQSLIHALQAIHPKIYFLLHFARAPAPID